MFHNWLLDLLGITQRRPTCRHVTLRMESLEDRITPANLVAAYAFAEGTGATVADTSGIGNTGTIANATWTNAGKYGNALDFNGTNALVTIPDTPSLELTTGLTLEAWVNPSKVTKAWRDVIYKGNDNYYLSATTASPLVSNPVPVGEVRIGSRNVKTFGNSALALNTWTHLAETYDGAYLRLYVNGALLSSVAQTGIFVSSTNALQIGGDSFWGDYFQGMIDEVRVYDGALTQAQIQTDMNTPIAVAADTTPPTAPTNLQAGSVSASQNNLSWTASSDNVGVANYLIYRQDPGQANFVQVGSTTGTTFNDTGLTASTTYSYQVIATDAANNLSQPSNTAIATTLTPDVIPPSAPSNLTATPISGAQIDLNWTAASDNVGVTNYLVMCQNPGSPTFVQVGTTANTSFSDPGLSANTTYSYQILAVDAANNQSQPSNIASATTPASPSASGLVAAYSFSEGSGPTVGDASGAGNSGTIVNATWTNSGKFGSALSFNGTNALVTIANTASLQLTTGMTLEAWVNPTLVTKNWRDVIFKGNDNYYLSATTASPSVSNPVPVGNVLVGSKHAETFGTSALALNTWTHLAATYDGTFVRLYMNGVLVSSLAQTGSITTSTNPLQMGGDSLFGDYFQGMIDEVRIYNVALTQSQVQADMNTPIAPDTLPPTTPTNLTATPVSSSQIQLTWSASTDNVGVTGYRVERQNPGSTTFVPIGTASGASYIDTGLSPNTAYDYQVVATDAAGNLSQPSLPASASTTSTIGPPSSFEIASGVAALYGVYEVVLTGNGGVANPFATTGTVTFTSPSNQAVTVNTFYDGGNTWRARAYVTQAGSWHWSSSSPDPGLNGASGVFTAWDTGLPGLLQLNPNNPTAWMNARGQWFDYIGDAAWILFDQNTSFSPNYQQFISDAAKQGINTIGPVGLLGSYGSIPNVAGIPSNDPWVPGNNSQYDLTQFDTSDSRMEWMFNSFPAMYLQGMFIGTQWQYNNAWKNLPQTVRNNTLNYMLARWGAFPNMIWQISCDQHTEQVSTQAFNRDVGNYLVANEPWRHLLSTQSIDQHFYFTTPSDLNWVDYISLQAGGSGPDTVGGNQIQNFAAVHRQVQMSEDWYEQDDYWHPELTATPVSASGNDNADPNFFVRWDMWSWILEGGSCNYGGRGLLEDPYSQSGSDTYDFPIAPYTSFSGYPLHGLDSIPNLWSYFQSQNIDLSQFTPNNSLVTSWSMPSGDTWTPNLTQRGNNQFLVYDPNAGPQGYHAQLAGQLTASMTINLTSAPSTFQVQWYRPSDGTFVNGPAVSGGAPVTLTAPWKGTDVVLLLTLV